MSGGIIIQRNSVLLVAVTDPCIYDTLSATGKSMVDAIDAKDPASRTQDDIHHLLSVLVQSCWCLG